MKKVNTSDEDHSFPFGGFFSCSRYERPTACAIERTFDILATALKDVVASVFCFRGEQVRTRPPKSALLVSASTDSDDIIDGSPFFSYVR